MQCPAETPVLPLSFESSTVIKKVRMFTGDSGYRLKCDKDGKIERKKEKNSQSVQAVS